MSRYPISHEVARLAEALHAAESPGQHWHQLTGTGKQSPYLDRARAIFSSAQAAYLAEYPDGDWDALEPLNRHGYIREARKEDDIEAERNAPEVGWDTPLTGGVARPENTPLYLHPETPLPQADRVASRPSKAEIHALAEQLYARQPHFRKWGCLGPEAKLPYLRTARDHLLREATVEWRDGGGLREEQEAARLEIIARALWGAVNGTSALRWAAVSPSVRAHWLQKSRPILDALNAVDTNQETDR